MKKRLGFILGLILIFAMGITVQAAKNEEIIVALGADLTQEQRKTVLGYMGLEESDLENCKVMTITNDMQQKYLSNYLDASIIGNSALSSVMLTKAEKGNGVLVTTQNINDCTTGMYRNALLTVGVEDTNVLVVSPVPSSGTTAFIGAVKAYEELTGEIISDKEFDTALNEFMLIGQLAVENIDNKKVENLIAFVKGKIAIGNIENAEDILNAIQDGEQEFNITLTEEQKHQLIKLMEKIDNLGLSPEKLLEQAKDFYKKYGSELFNDAQEKVKETVSNSILDYFSDMLERIKSLFHNFFMK